MASVGSCDNPVGDIFSDLRGNPVLYLELETKEAVILQQEVIAAIRSKDPTRRFKLSKVDKGMVEKTRDVLEKENSQYLRMPGIRLPETREWMLEFTDLFQDRKMRHFLLGCIRQSRTLNHFSERLEKTPELLDEWLEFRSQKLMRAFLTWANSLPIFPFYEYCSVEGIME